jgi:hypothetical protein
MLVTSDDDPPLVVTMDGNCLRVRVSHGMLITSDDDPPLVVTMDGNCLFTTA